MQGNNVMTKTITEEQLIEEFTKAMESSRYEGKEPYTWTVPEVKREFNVSRRKAKRAMRRLVDEGMLYPKRVWRTDDWGDERPYPGYKLSDHLIPKEEEHE